MCISRTKAGDP
uniref:Uncharacterized protein n=1 Tax=Anguilla anguilla TaxID=7936 RepID=A0A0E9VBR4_ANGAN